MRQNSEQKKINLKKLQNKIIDFKVYGRVMLME
jgi:hypothetical protein